MANYNKFKKILNDSIDPGTIVRNDLKNGFGQLRVFIVANEIALTRDACASFSGETPGQNLEQAFGRCCQWTVPACVRRVTFELWSGGGGGAGVFCNQCSNQTIHGGGGGYAVKTIETNEGCQYTICAGGTFPCLQNRCSSAGGGCMSFVTGYNLNNFCVNGGCGGCVCVGGDAYSPCFGDTCIGGCAPCACGFYGADFGIMGTSGSKIGHSPNQDGGTCSRNVGTMTGIAPFTGKNGILGTFPTWCLCGCYVVWPGGGGISGSTAYCGNCNVWEQSTGGMGGSGMVKVTYG